MSKPPRFTLVCFSGDGRHHALDPELSIAHAAETLCRLPNSQGVQWEFAGSTISLSDIDCRGCRDEAEIIVSNAALRGTA